MFWIIGIKSPFFLASKTVTWTINITFLWNLPFNFLDFNNRIIIPPISLFLFERDADVGLDHGKWNHVCFTWSNTNGDYQWYKDGVVVNSGTGVNTGGTISSGGTTVIGQDQDNVGGGFNADQSFVGDVTEVNVWSTVLSGSDIAAQYANCQITQGSVTWWSQFRDGVHGNVFVVDP